MTISKITSPIQPLDLIDKTNEIIDEVNNSDGGSSLDIGMIVTSTIPLTNAGLHLLDGTLLQYGSYQAFIDYIASIYDASASYFCSEADWQTAVTTYGVCGKFVYDSTNNTVRLPRITGFIEGASGTTTLGDVTEAGLPNITGSTDENSTIGLVSRTNATQTGAFTKGENRTYAPPGSPSVPGSMLSFDASLSNSIYGNSNTVQPQSTKVLYYIVIANTTKTAIEVDIDEIATDLNGKADVDLTNCTKPHVIETYSNGASGYRIWSDGLIEQWGEVSLSTSPASVNLFKTYSDTDYQIHIQNYYIYSAAADVRAAYVYSKTTSNFQIGTISTSTTANWMTLGY